MKIIKLKICLCNVKNTFKYFSEATKDNGRYYYRIGDATIEITQFEFNRVVRNPRLYYFSTALWLHLRIQKQIGKLD